MSSIYRKQDGTISPGKYVEIEIVTHSPEGTRDWGQRIGGLVLPGDIILLVGELGSGKTCLTQGIATGLGVKEHALSPTFVIMREMHGRLPLYHMDLYRLDRIEETRDLGLDDYFYGQGLCVVEWAEKAMALMPPDHLLIEISYIADTERRMRLRPRGRRYEELLAELDKSGHVPKTM
jgi:tRNA threonylcarbamoyladenosine biosynthesis protein TsaE